MRNDIAYINIGSNIGDRHGYLSQAVAMIMDRIDSGARVSDIVESEPWGFESPNKFLNVGITVSTTLAPEELLRSLQDIEHAISPSAHRDATGAYIDRACDIDLILYGNRHISTPELTLPHPRMHQRPFVMIPLRQLIPDYTD